MTSCTGLGECFQQCVCICIDSTTCNCGHKNHEKFDGGGIYSDKYCKPNCAHNCQLVECDNYNTCGQKRPQWLLNCNKSSCLSCAVAHKQLKFINPKEYCRICCKHTNTIHITCDKHLVCEDCITKEHEKVKKSYLICPFCPESSS